MDGDTFSQDPANDDDLRLAVRSLNDAQAFATLYNRYVDTIFRYCYRRLGDRAAAEDATQLIFEKALIALPRLAPQSTFRAWLFTIAHNTVIDMARRRSRSPLLDIDDLTLFDPEPSPKKQPSTVINVTTWSLSSGSCRIANSDSSICASRDSTTKRLPSSWACLMELCARRNTGRCIG